MRQFDRPDDFDLDIRLEPARGAGVLILLPPRILADHSRPDNAPCQTDQTNCGQATCQTCAGQATCQTCQTNCAQATCHTCAGQATCQTCETCAGQNTCHTCAQYTCHDPECATGAYTRCFTHCPGCKTP